MLFVGIFCLELFILYLFSKFIILELSKLFLRLFNSHKASGIILAILFLPGTFLHEWAHLVMAVLVRVEPTHFSLIPKIGQESIELGSVGIVKPDPIRRILIGMAPFLFGTIVVLLGIQIFFSLNIQNPLIIGLLIYALFTTTNTMFSSKRDLEGAIELILAILIVGWLVYFLGLYSYLPTINFSPLFSLFESSSKILLIPLGIDLVILASVKILNSVIIK